MEKFWSVFAMPIGLLFCFTPALIAWLTAELGGSKERDEGPRK